MRLITNLLSVAAVASFVLAACSGTGKENENSKEPNEMTEQEMLNYARQLAQDVIITDGHVDLPYRFQTVGEWIDVSKQTEEGDFDFVRAREGGLDAPFMSIYVPSSYQVTGGAKELADSLINLVTEISERYPEQFAPALTTADVVANFEVGRISLPMGMENGAPIEEDIANVAYFHSRGIRYITLTHATDNLICDSSYDTTATWGGLSDFGREVVQEMNSVGIMIDVSHISDDAMHQVFDLTTAPVIASHSSCRHFTPGWQRNMPDDLLKKLGENGGVIQINFGTAFLDGDIADQNRPKSEALSKILEEKGLGPFDLAARPIVAQFWAENDYLYADIKHVVDHIDHVVELIGVDHVAFGSDFDGLGDTLPTGLKDVSDYPNLIYELLNRGYSAEDIEKICYKNVFRVWEEVERVASQSASP